MRSLSTSSGVIQATRPAKRAYLITRQDDLIVPAGCDRAMHQSEARLPGDELYPNGVDNRQDGRTACFPPSLRLFRKLSVHQLLKTNNLLALFCKRAQIAAAGFSLPAALESLQLGDRLVQLLVDHFLVPQ